MLDVLGVGELADEMEVSLVTIWRWNQAGKLPKPDADLKRGPVWRRSTIDRWKENR